MNLSLRTAEALTLRELRINNKYTKANMFIESENGGKIMKLTLIGGAGVRSVFFVNGLLKRAKKIGISEFVIYDIDKEKINTIGKICKYVAEKGGAPFTVSTESDIRKAVKGADFIVTTIRVGGDHSRVIDERIALNHGILGQETTGAGGFSMAVRTIPVIAEYCRLTKELAPNAWTFNFTNPSGLVTQAMRSLGYDKVIGICDTPSSTKIRLAAALGLNEEKLHAEFFGLNHLSWIRKLEYEGKDILSGVTGNRELLSKIDEFRMFDPDLIKSMGYLPNEYLYYYYHREQSVKNIIGSNATRGQFIEQNNKDMLAELNAMNIDANPEKALETYLYYMEKRELAYMAVETHRDTKPLERGTVKMPDSEGYAGVMMDFAQALVSDSHKEIILSVPNNGSVDGFNDDDVMEITCTVDKDGAHPAKIGKVPEEMYLLMRTVKLYEKLTVKASFTKSRDLAIKALMVHPLINSYSLAKSIVAEYLDAYREYIGDFN